MPRYNIFITQNPNTNAAFFINKDAANDATSAKTSVSAAFWQTSGSLVHTVQFVGAESALPDYDEQTKTFTSVPGEWSNLFNTHGYIPTDEEMSLAGFDNYVCTDYYN